MRGEGWLFNHEIQCHVWEETPSLVNSVSIGRVIMEGGTTIQDWKLYRQFQKTLESLNDNNEDETKTTTQDSILERKFHDILEIDIEDEGEQLGGAQNHLELEQFSEKLLTKNYFDEWREQADLAATQRRKADFYHRFSVLEKRFKQWKIYTRRAKQEKERQKWLKAIFHWETQLLRYERIFIIVKIYDCFYGGTCQVGSFIGYNIQ